MLNAVQMELRASGKLGSEMQQVADRVRTQTVEDIVCNPPDVILVDDLTKSLAAGMDAIAFFSEDEEFRRVFATYARLGAAANYTSYRRHSDLAGLVRPRNCRTLY
jgi:hypothetical protein